MTRKKEIRSPEETLPMLKTDFLLDQRFFAAILLKMDIREDTENILPPFTYAGTDGETMWWRPELFKIASYEQLLGIMAHEVMHIVALHHLRIGERDPEIWNLACDYAINRILIEAGFKLPPGVLDNSKYEEWEAEQIYKDLMKDQKHLKQLLQEVRNSKGNPNAFGRGCGWVFEKKAADGSKLNETERKAAEAEQKVLNEQAAKIHEKQCGNLPGFLKRLVNQLQQPKVNWRELLAQFINIVSKSDYTWSLPNRRYIAQDVYLPRVFKPLLGTIVDGIDASGSINEKELEAEVSELRGQLFAYEGVELKVIFFDTKASEPIEIYAETEVKDIKCKEMGGGTDYKPLFKKIDQANLEPVCTIVLTDGYCNSFPKEPSYPVLWILTQKHKDWKPPFGTTIYMELE